MLNMGSVYQKTVFYVIVGVKVGILCDNPKI